MYSIISSKLSNSIKNCFSMINQFSKYSSKKRYYSHGLKVAILGANGKIGQNVAMMLKQSSSVKEIALYDITNTEGLCMELNYIDTNTRVCSYTGHKTLKDALNHSNIVVIVAGLARRDGMTRFDLFDHNAEIISEFSSCSATVCPKAMLAIATNPVNSLVPVANEIYSKINKSNTGENIFGVTTLDGIRANTFVAEMLSEKPEKVFSPVIGGHSNNTIVPILSQTKPTSEFSTSEIVRLTKAIQEAGDEVLKAKATGSATLSAAYAVTKFTIALANGLAGQKGVVESAYVSSSVIPNVSYLSTLLELGPQGIQKNLGLPQMSDYECCLLETAIPYLKRDIILGEQYVEKEFKQTGKNKLF